jgi:TM2 domain-containing membrane protein YozV
VQDTNSTPPTDTPTPTPEPITPETPITSPEPVVSTEPVTPVEPVSPAGSTESATPVSTVTPEPSPATTPAPEAATATQATSPAVASSVEGLPPKNFLVALLLSIFLGNLGIDRFYLGHIGLGVAKLLLNWLTFGIWWLVDVILIATKKVKNVNWES